MRILMALIAGLVFGIGLIISGMSNPAKVLGFLDLAGNWDPSLALVMAGAILVSVIQVVLPRLVSGKLNTFGTSFVANVEQVARGDISGAVALVPPTVQLAFRDVATRSYTEALQAVLIVQAAICFIAAILVFRLCRKK